MKTALVLGAGGFIGSHLVKRLKSEGFWVRGVDLKRPEYDETAADDFLLYDLRDPKNVEAAIKLTYTYLEDALWEKDKEANNELTFNIPLSS